MFKPVIALTVARLIGALLLMSRSPPVSGVRSNSYLCVSIWIDYVTGALLAVSPWLFGYAQGLNSWLPHVIVGLAVIGYAP